MSELPKGWINTTLDDISTIITGKTPSKKNPEYFNGSIPFIKPGDVINQGVIKSTIESLTEIGADTVPVIPEGAITVTCIGNLGRVAIAKTKSVTNQQINSVVPHDDIFSKYLYYYLLTMKQWMETESSSTTVAIINKSRFSRAPIKLAPLNEQIRIANKLDSILVKVDAAQARLDKIPHILKRFRQSVLAAATSGELTKEWREKNKFNSRSTILKIKEQNVLKKKKGDFDTKLFSELPKGWNWTQIKEVGHVQLGRQRAPKYHSGENMKPYLRVMNVKEGYIDSGDIMEMVFDKDDYEKYKLSPGDILLNEGQSFELIGRPAIYNGEVEGSCFTNTLVRFRAHSPLKTLFSFYVFMHYMKNGRFQQISTRTVNISHLGAGRFAELEFPFPPIEEQNEIVRRVESLFTMADAVEKQYKDAKARTNRLTQSILAKAFRGELVPQDANDEPAEVLLAKIQAISDAAVTKKKTTPKTKKKTKSA